MPTNRYIVFKPPVVEDPTDTDYIVKQRHETRSFVVGMKFDLKKTKPASDRWWLYGLLVDAFDADTKTYQYIFLPGSEIAGEYQIESIAQTIARELNEKESKKNAG